LRGYRAAAEQKAATQATEQTREQARQEGREEGKAEAKKNFNRSWISTDRVYSRIDGEFHGLRKYTKKAIIRLEDGTVWKQVNEGDNLEAKLTDHPPVMITHSVVGYKMHVIGAGGFYGTPGRKKQTRPNGRTAVKLVANRAKPNSRWMIWAALSAWSPGISTAILISEVE